MRRELARLALPLFTLLGVAVSVFGQLQGNNLPNPRLFTVTPCGGKVGTTIDVTFSGTDLEEPDGLHFSHPGIKAEAIKPPETPTPEPMKPQAKPGKGKAAQPRVVTSFKVTIPPDTPLGQHDVRVVNKWGVSNPRVFVVGDRPESLEKEPNNDVPEANRVDQNTTINGTIGNPTDVDYFVFAGKKGQRVVASCLASSIDSRLHAALEMYTAAGKKLAFNRCYNHNDALVDVTLPADGDYYLRLFEFTHALGGPEQFYRLTLTTGLWVDAVFPAVVEPGKTTPVTVYGRNLPGGVLDPAASIQGRSLERLSATVTAPADPHQHQRLSFSGRISSGSGGLDGFDYRLATPAGPSNPVLITYARAPVILDNFSNDIPEKAQEISFPCEIAGLIEKRRDRDWYGFSAKKGDNLLIDVLGDRLGTVLDLYFLVRRVDNKQDLGEFDDSNETLTPFKFYTRSEDPPAYRFSAPVDGKYLLLVSSRDADTRAGPHLGYCVRITPEKPDFRLIVLPPDDARPDACCVRQGGAEACTVLVWRQDGFAGSVRLSAEGLPAGVTCPPQNVGPNLRQATLVLTAAPDAPAWTGEIRIKGAATIQGKSVVREARPATITWPTQPGSNIPAVSRLDRSLVLAVRDKAPFSLTASLEKQAATAGSKVNAILKLSRLWPEFKTPLTITPMDLPQGLVFGTNNQPRNMAAGKDGQSVVFTIGNNVPPGAYNIVLRGQTQMPYNKDPKATQKPNTIVVQPSHPVSLTVLPGQVANLSVGNNNLTLKAGGQVELVVKVNRTNDYQGEFKVQLVLPPDMKGIVTEAVTIPSGQNEAKLLLQAAADTSPGNRTNLVVRAVAVLNGDVPVNHETKINVNVVK